MVASTLDFSMEEFAPESRDKFESIPDTLARSLPIPRFMNRGHLPPVFLCVSRVC